MEQNHKIVYNNINESPYYFNYEDYKLYFSSEFYRKNFISKIRTYINEEKYKLMNRYKIIDPKFIKVIEDVLIIALYKRIEKRGFRVYKNNSEYKEN